MHCRWYCRYFCKSPEVELGLKSVLFIELIEEVTRIHSLNFPLVLVHHELVHALSTIMTRDRKILIKDWYEGLYELVKK